MKLVHVRLARSIWLFEVRDLNPKGKDLVGDLVEWVKGAYDFAEAPDPDDPKPNTIAKTSPPPQSPPEQAAGGLAFRRGRFQIKEEIFVGINSLTIYDDGVVVDTTSSTSDGDQFAEDLLKSATEEFKLSYDDDTIRRKLYLSQLVIRSDMALESLNPRLATFSEKIPPNITGGQSLRFGIGSIAFWSEPNDAGNHRIVSVERQLGRPFSENRFYSEAPLQTHLHLGLLEEFEATVIGAQHPGSSSPS